jgi:hypothetical protein
MTHTISKLKVTMRVIAIAGLFVLGFWCMAAGGIVGGAVHQIPSIGKSVLGCAISTVGLGLCLSGLVVAKSSLTMRVARDLACIAILYGIFGSLENIILQSQIRPTLIYGIYMSVISIVAILLVMLGPRAT